MVSPSKNEYRLVPSQFSTPRLALHLRLQPSHLLLYSKAQVGHLNLQTQIPFPLTNYWLLTWRTCGRILVTLVQEESPTMLLSAIDISMLDRMLKTWLKAFVRAEKRG